MMAELTVQRIIRIIKSGRPLQLILARFIGNNFEYKNFTFKYSGFLLTLDGTRLSQYCWTFGDDYRLSDIDMVKSLLKKGGTFVDVGSNIGTLTMAGSKAVGRTGTVYSFEPHPKTFKRLSNNLDLNDFSQNVKKYNFGIGAESSVLQFSDLGADDQNHITQDGSIRVAVTSLSEIFSTEEEIDLLKIDVEGYEIFVLEGAEKIVKNVQHIMVEVSESHYARYGYSVSDLLTWLFLRGYRLMDEKGNPISVDFIPSETCNVIASR